MRQVTLKQDSNSNLSKFRSSQLLVGPQTNRGTLSLKFNSAITAIATHRFARIALIRASAMTVNATARCASSVLAIFRAATTVIVTMKWHSATHLLAAAKHLPKIRFKRLQWKGTPRLVRLRAGRIYTRWPVMIILVCGLKSPSIQLSSIKLRNNWQEIRHQLTLSWSSRLGRMSALLWSRIRWRASRSLSKPSKKKERWMSR